MTGGQFLPGDLTSREIDQARFSWAATPGRQIIQWNSTQTLHYCRSATVLVQVTAPDEAAMQLEIEQKFPLANPAQTRRRLEELGLEFAAPVRQVDTYFAHPARDFAQTDEALRIRQVGDANAITYKGPKLDATTKTRRELELPIAPGVVAATQFAELLGLLGFCPVGIVSKDRQVAHLQRGGMAIEVCWDEIHELGVFLELEIVAPASQADAARGLLAQLAQQLELEVSERRSYLELLLAKTA